MCKLIDMSKKIANIEEQNTVTNSMKQHLQLVKLFRKKTCGYDSLNLVTLSAVLTRDDTAADVAGREMAP